MNVTVIAALILAVVLLSCSQTKYVPVCSEHGGVKTMTVSDHDDDYATRDAVCKDGTTQRPMQVDDGHGRWHLIVPSEK
jgi:hypothetical protein